MEKINLVIMEIVTATMTEFSIFLFGTLGLIGFLIIAYFLHKNGGEYKFNSYKFEFYLLLLLPIFWAYMAVLVAIAFIINNDWGFGGMLILYWTTVLAIPFYLFFVFLMLIIRFLRINFIGK